MPCILLRVGPFVGAGSLCDQPRVLPDPFRPGNGSEARVKAGPKSRIQAPPTFPDVRGGEKGVRGCPNLAKWRVPVSARVLLIRVCSNPWLSNWLSKSIVDAKHAPKHSRTLSASSLFCPMDDRGTGTAAK